MRKRRSFQLLSRAWETTRCWAAALLLLAALSACGGGGTEEAGQDQDAADAAPAEPSDASAAQSSGSAYGSNRACPEASVVSAAVGQPMVADPNTPATAGFFCPYVSPDVPLAVNVTFTNMDLTSAPEPGQEPVPGIGEVALWSDGFAEELVVWSGRDSLIIGITSGPSMDAKAAAVTLAKSILASE